MSFENSYNTADELMRGIAGGDEKAFRKLFEDNIQKLIYFVFAIVKSKDISQEIVDEVFIRLWKNRENAVNIRNIKVYLYVAAKNAALNYISRKAFEQITEPLTDIDITINSEQVPDKQMITAELFNKIHEAVNSLPPRCKIIFKLVREDGLTYKEVSDILNISENTVDAQMVIAAKRIREKIKLYLDFTPGTVLKKN
ncbi:MAG TPA: RNA polymerase sigma-70 factor [Parafilimonas sp.]|jgi:RNA polymerase sigma-70 factor (ECF subfamily)